MAIADSLPGIEVTIVVNGQPLKEYLDSELPDDNDKVTRRIEAVSGQVFEVHVKAKKSTLFKGDCLTASIHIDGEWKQSPIIAKWSVQYQDTTRISQGVDAPGNLIRKYCFAALELDNDRPSRHGEAGRTQDLGTIEVRLSHGNQLRMTAGAYVQNTNLGSLSEKALKGRSVSHTVSLKPATPHITGAFWEVSDVEKDAAIYKFLYSSRESLKSMLIIPRTPSPPPLEDIANPNADQIKQLQAKLKAQNAELEKLQKIKRERPDDIASPRPRKAARDATVFVVDDDGGIARAATVGTGRREPEVIVLDDD